MPAESRVVLVRVQRPGPFFPVQKKYARRRAGVFFEGERLFRVVGEAEYAAMGEADAKGYLTEKILKAVKGDPVFFVRDPYSPAAPSEPSTLAPFQAKAKEIAQAIQKGEAAKPAEVPVWAQPQVPAVLKKLEQPSPPMPAERPKAKKG